MTDNQELYTVQYEQFAGVDQSQDPGTMQPNKLYAGSKNMESHRERGTIQTRRGYTRAVDEQYAQPFTILGGPRGGRLYAGGGSCGGPAELMLFPESGGFENGNNYLIRISADPAGCLPEGDTITFTSTVDASISGTVNWQWDWTPGGTPSADTTGASATTSFSSPGYYTVRAWLVDTGVTYWNTLTVYVTTGDCTEPRDYTGNRTAVLGFQNNANDCVQILDFQFDDADNSVSAGTTVSLMWAVARATRTRIFRQYSGQVFEVGPVASMDFEITTSEYFVLRADGPCGYRLAMILMTVPSTPTPDPPGIWPPPGAGVAAPPGEQGNFPLGGGGGGGGNGGGGVVGGGGGGENDYGDEGDTIDPPLNPADAVALVMTDDTPVIAANSQQIPFKVVISDAQMPSGQPEGETDGTVTFRLTKGGGTLTTPTTVTVTDGEGSGTLEYDMDGANTDPSEEVEILGKFVGTTTVERAETDWTPLNVSKVARKYIAVTIADTDASVATNNPFTVTFTVYDETENVDTDGAFEDLRVLHYPVGAGLAANQGYDITLDSSTIRPADWAAGVASVSVTVNSVETGVNVAFTLKSDSYGIVTDTILLHNDGDYIDMSEVPTEWSDAQPRDLYVYIKNSLTGAASAAEDGNTMTLTARLPSGKIVGTATSTVDNGKGDGVTYFSDFTVDASDTDFSGRDRMPVEITAEVS